MLNFLKKAYLFIIFCGSLLQSPILLLCRLYWGALFMAAGWGKLSDISHFAQVLEKFDVLLPYFTAYFVALIEFLGGLCLLLGFASRLAAIPLIIVMIAAYLTAHIASLYVFFEKPSVFVAEAPFNFLLISLLVLAFGPGYFSIDFLLEKWCFNKRSKSQMS